MSTKIYNGYEIDLPISEVLSFLKKVRIDLVNIRERKANEKLAYQIACEFDSQTLGLKPLNKISPFDLAMKVQDEAVAAQYSKSYLNSDYSCSVIVIPKGNVTLALFYDKGNPEYLQSWESQPEVKDYHYQDQTDPPEAVSDEEWQQRRIDWLNALPGSGIPSLNGLECALLDSEIWYSIYQEHSNIFQYIPDLSQRIETQANERQLDRYKTKFLKENNKEQILSASEWMEFSSYYNRFKNEKSDNFKEELTELRKELGLLLVPEITRDTIINHNTKISSP